jgi:AraC-like DNA-binding protein
VGRFVHELALAYAVHQLREGAGDVRPLRVWFAHARPPEVRPLQAFFGTDDLAFGGEDSGLAFGRSELDRAMLRPDRHAVETFGQLVDADVRAHPPAQSLSARVEAHLASSLPQDTDVADVARAMHMSARTLQRRLEQEGTRFTEVLDRARLQLARRLLADARVTLTDVAYRVGFADLATFSRAFKRWTGLPPGQWRLS